MLQSASDWWYGTGENKDSTTEDQDKDKEKNLDNNNEDEKKADDAIEEEEKIEIEFKKELKSVKCTDFVISIFKLIDFEASIKLLLKTQFDDKLTETECSGILSLFNKILEVGVPTKSYLSSYSDEILIGEIILSYFASISPTNPDEFGCWDRWIKYRLNKEISNGLSSEKVKTENLEKFS